VIGFVKC